ncbi:MAG: acylphosphatase [Caldisericota bacterium]|nr:acylphosphatase [Caldisericota bacterium]
MSPKRLEARVSGFVQGVGFRYFVKRNADILNLVGYTENLHDGSVHIMAEGEEKDLVKFLDVLRKGNSFSLVKNVDYSFSEPLGEFSAFKIY